MERLSVEILNSFPKVDRDAVRRELESSLKRMDRKIVVLDDDPTGIQTVHDVSVYTSWDREAITSGFLEAAPIFFILTNSRGLTAGETERIHAEIAAVVCRVSRETEKDYILMSRSDSTLRGHYPLETETLRETIEAQSPRRFHGEIIAPFFIEGGRYTIDDVHYVKEGDLLVPAGETEFAKDKGFGYQSSHLGDYVAEKTHGKYSRESCVFISLAELRGLDYEAITKKLRNVDRFNKIILNAIDYIDVQIFAIALINVILEGKDFLIRSAAALPKVLGGVSDQPLLQKHQLIDSGNANGGIVLIGSHVNKTTQQFNELKYCKNPLVFIEFNQHRVLESGGLDDEVKKVTAKVEENIQASKNVVVYTRRDRFDLDTGDKDAQLKVSTQISDAVTGVIAGLSIRPSFIVAKGGATSSDVGTKALNVKKAAVMGQIKPGIPVWMTGTESKFPNMPYIIFPGNVGEVQTLRDIVDLLSS